MSSLYFFSFQMPWRHFFKKYGTKNNASAEFSKIKHKKIGMTAKAIPFYSTIK